MFVFPLRSDGYGVGLITRISSDKHRIPLGYFFKHKYVLIPTMIDFDLIKKNKTILIRKFGIQGIRNGTWHIINRLADFNRTDWPIPVFLRHTEPFPPRLIQYDDNLDEIEDRKAPPTLMPIVIIRMA